MRMRQSIAGLFGLFLAGAACAGEPTLCDRLAGSPTDPNRVGDGTGLYGIEPPPAIAACETALAAEPDNPRLHFALGRAHAAAALLDKQPGAAEEAARHFKAAADKDYPAAQVELAFFHWHGSAGLQKDTAQAMRLLATAMKTDAGEARLQRRNLFADTTFSPEPDAAELQVITDAAKAGDADALYALSLPLNLGGDSEEDLAALLHRAAALGNAPAALDLARLYFHGKGGLAKNPEESLRLIRQAAASDDPAAWETAAAFFERGNFGAPKDEAQAVHLVGQASDAGNAAAQYRLGTFYDHGKGGLSPDAHEAARLYRLSADQGNSDAALALARCMAEGRCGFNADKANAAAYLRRAARWSPQAKDELAKLAE